MIEALCAVIGAAALPAGSDAHERIRWYVAYPLSLRHIEEMMAERGAAPRACYRFITGR